MPLCEIQVLPQVLEDLLKVSIVGDLLFEAFQPCPFDLTVITSRCSLHLQIHHSAPVSWCSKIECHLVTALENMLLGLGCCFASVS